MIENIVIGSGAQDLFAYIGVVDKLFKMGHIEIGNIKKVYGTSAGALVGSLIAAKCDWGEFVNYAINKPWGKYLENAFTDGMINFNERKGLIDMKCFEDALIPPFRSCGFKSTVTFKEMYEKTGIELNAYALNVNTWKHECFNHINTPNLEVIKGVCMSSTFPFLVQPIYYNGSYYIDGGMEIDCPIEQCLETCDNDKTICIRKLCKISPLKVKLEENATLLPFISIFIKKTIAKGRMMDDLSFKNTIDLQKEEVDITEFVSVMDNEESRRELIEYGKNIAYNYLTEKSKHCVDELS